MRYQNLLPIINIVSQILSWQLCSVGQVFRRCLTLFVVVDETHLGGVWLGLRHGDRGRVSHGCHRWRRHHQSWHDVIIKRTYLGAFRNLRGEKELYVESVFVVAAAAGGNSKKIWKSFLFFFLCCCCLKESIQSFFSSGSDQWKVKNVLLYTILRVRSR